MRKTFPVAPFSVKESDTERARLAALRSYAVLDTPPEPPFDEIVRLASVACRTPISALTLVDSDRCWHKARIGLADGEVPRDVSFCGYAFASSGTFVVPDAKLDERFKHRPMVAEGGIRFYAGVPLISSSGHALGTLCVVDYQPHDPSMGQLAALRSLADHAMRLLELRRARLVAPTIADQPPAAAAAVPSDGGCRVLVVDDDEIIRSFVRKLVARLGYRVIEATNGAEALTQIEKHGDGIGVVLTDVNMPVMDGLTLVRVLNKRPTPPAIVVMSGRFDASLRAALSAEGITALLGKPFSTDELELTLLQAKAPAS